MIEFGFGIIVGVLIHYMASESWNRETNGLKIRFRKKGDKFKAKISCKTKYPLLIESLRMGDTDNDFPLFSQQTILNDGDTKTSDFPVMKELGITSIEIKAKSEGEWVRMMPILGVSKDGDMIIEVVFV